MAAVSIGTSGYVYTSWKNVFYPPGLPRRQWLSFYATKFSTVEINATFYRSFPKETYEKWAAQAPQGFSFAIKGTRLITHRKRLQNLTTEVSDFWSQAAGLGDKLAVILWQLPASFACNERTKTAMEAFLALLPVSVQHAVELRNASWFEKQALSLFRQQQTAVVMNETQAFPTITESVGGFAYLRFHGPTSLYASSYTKRALMLWAEKIKQLRKSCSVYCYFNNDISGYAVSNAETLRQLIGA